MMGGLLPITIGLPTSLCQNKINSAPWNPKNYSIQNTPMLYLNGTTDPATPLPWALSHFTAQTQNRNKLFISFADAGHSILMDPRWERCSDLIFEKISSHRFSQITENILFIQNGCPPPKKKISDNVQF
jgi:alpha-beta hydrolase superfamily lysophospholipase